MEEWIKAINRILYTPNGGGMFGRSLRETVKLDACRGGTFVLSPAEPDLRSLAYGVVPMLNVLFWSNNGRKSFMAEPTMMDEIFVFRYTPPYCTNEDSIFDVGYEFLSGGGMVPIIVEKCVAFLTERAVGEEGIFRIPGLKDEVEHLKITFNKGGIFQLSLGNLVAIIELYDIGITYNPLGS